MKKIKIKNLGNNKYQKFTNNKTQGMITKISKEFTQNKHAMPLKEKLISLFISPRLPIKKLIYCIHQLSVMSRAGIAISKSIKEVANSNDDARIKQIFTQVANDLNQGQSLSSSLNNFCGQVGDITLALVKLGESTGNMSESLAKLAEILEDVEQNERNFKKAIRYPVIVIVALAVAFIFIITLIVPKFRAIFESYNAKLPLPTQILISLENFFTNYGIFMILLLLTTWIYLRKNYTKNPEFKAKLDKLILKIYIVGKITFYSNMSRFSLIFTELIKAGIPISSALQIATSTLSNEFIIQKLHKADINIKQGVSLTQSFKQSMLFENMLLAMINAGEQSGNLDDMLAQTSNYYKMKFNDLTQNISAYIEPILLIILALMITLIALGIFMPMWDLTQVTKN